MVDGPELGCTLYSRHLYIVELCIAQHDIHFSFFQMRRARLVSVHYVCDDTASTINNINDQRRGVS